MDEEFMQSYYAAYNSEDATRLGAFYHEDIELESAQGRIEGAPALLQTYKTIIENFRDVMTPLSITIAKGNADCTTVATVEILDQFTAKVPVDDFMGQSFAQGDSFELRLTGTYQIIENKIKHVVIATR